MVTATQMHALRLRMSRSIGDSIPLMLCLEEFQKYFGRFPNQCCQGRRLRVTARFRWCQAGSTGMSDHIRNTGPMLASPRCGAKTRCGGACRSPAVHGRKRCRMHGGAHGSGAPRANRNARKHGMFSRNAIAERRQIQMLLGEARKLLEEMK
jgi:hypothetical protein